MAKIRVLIVEDQALFRDGLRAVFERYDDLQVVGDVGDASAVLRLVRELQPDLILMGLQLSGRSGIDITREVLADHPDSKVIALTMYRDESMVNAMIQAGARGYVLKQARAAELVQAIRAVAAGGAVIDPHVAPVMLRHYRRLAADVPQNSGEELTAREQELLQLLATGKSNRAIAETLHLSVQTVKNQLSEMYFKLGAANRTEAVALAMQNGLLRRED